MVEQLLGVSCQRKQAYLKSHRERDKIDRTFIGFAAWFSVGWNILRGCVIDKIMGCFNRLQYPLILALTMLLCDQPLAGSPQAQRTLMLDYDCLGCNRIYSSLSRPVSEAEYKRLIELARGGDYDRALRRLATLVKAFPGEPRFLYDYITVLGWAGRDEQVLEQLLRIDIDRAPAYVADTVGKSARNQRQYDTAIQIYRSALKKQQGRQQSILGLALALVDKGDHEAAVEVLQPLLKRTPAPVPALEILAYIQERRRDFTSALSAYDRILELQPDHRGARRGRILAALRLGMPHLASEMAGRNPDVLSESDRQAIKGDLAAMTIRWGRLYSVDPGERYRNTDRAIELLQQQINEYPDKTSAAAVRARLDLMVAYRDRRRMEEAVAIHKALEPEGVEIPYYALAAAGDAYLYLHQAQTAVPLLEAAFARRSDDIDIGMSLFYAYADSGNLNAALSHIDRLATRQPEWILPPGGSQREWNPDRLQADIAAALGRAYADDLEEAQQRLAALARQAPNNTNVRKELGHIYLWRGWPRLALDEFLSVLTLDPNHLGAQTGLVEATAMTGDLVAADAALVPLVERYGDDTEVRRLERRRQTRQLRELWVQALGGSSSGSAEGSDDLGYETYLYDAPWTSTLRPFVHGYYAEATYYDKSVHYDRLGVGLHYRSRNIELRGELDDGSSTDPGLALQLAWSADDFWSLRAGLDSRSDNVPLQAHGEGIYGWSATLGVEYRFHEGRSLGFEFQHLGLSDGNNRRIFSVYGRQRLFTSSRYKLDGTLYLYQQRNSKSGAPYFNPSQDRSAEITLANEWLTYRHYEKTFRQRLLISAGRNSQRGFGNDTVGSLAYEHHWDLNDRLGFSYGLSRLRSVYDGVTEFANRFFLRLYTRF